MEWNYKITVQMESKSDLMATDRGNACKIAILIYWSLKKTRAEVIHTRKKK